jgi:hypothetical protein
LAPTDPGKYEYTFISAIDASKREEIKDINRSASIEIKEDSKAVEIKVDPPKPHQLVKPMTEAQQIDEIANRVYYQNDGSEKYLDWVERLPYNGAFAKKVSKKVLELLDKETAEIKKNTGVNGLPTTNATGNPNVTSFNYADRYNAARENIRKAREKYDKLNTKKNEDSIEKRYAFVEVIQAEIFLERVELSNNQRSAFTQRVSNNTEKIERLNAQLAKELQLINIITLRKNVNEIKDTDSIDFIMAKIKLYQNELVVARLDKDERKIDTLNRELTVQSLRVLKLRNKIKGEAATNDRLFQEEYNDRPDSLPKFITANLVCIFSYVKGIDDNQRGAPDKNPIIAITTPTSSPGYGTFNFGNQKPQTYEEWARKTEPGRLKAKLARYEIEKVRYRELKIRYVNKIAEDNKKAGNPCGADDAYCVMAKCIIDYWKSTAAQPFATSPPILPCLIPNPGTYIPVYYGDEAKLGGDLRRAWNTGKRFKLEPNLQTATRAVATAVAVSCAKHLKDLKFIYNGKIPVGTGTAPMIGFSPLAL